MILNAAHIKAVEEAAQDELTDLCQHGYSLNDAVSRLLISFEDCRLYFVKEAPDPVYAEEYQLAMNYLRRKRLAIV